MSHKKAKQARREEKQAKQEAEKKKPIGRITIDVYEDMTVDVHNFPNQYNIAMMVMCNALLGVSDYFFKRLNSQPKSNILVAKPGMSPEDIMKIAKGN